MGHTDSYSDISYVDLCEERSSSNLLVITQSDTYQHVFLPLEQCEVGRQWVPTC
jgi:hypothetical protein